LIQVNLLTIKAAALKNGTLLKNTDLKIRADNAHL
jgi:hypothetical protein